MKALLFVFLALTGQAWAVFAPGTTGLYDLEQNLSDTAGTAHGTELAAMSYQTTKTWHGTYCGGGNGQFSIPAATLNAASGTVEFSIRTGASIPNSSDWLVIGTAVGGTRTLELYNFGGTMYVYSGAFGINSASYGLSANTNYYIKLTWDASNIKMYGGAWTTAGTVTLTEKYSNSGTYTSMNGVNVIALMRNPVAPGDPSFYNPGFIDWIRTRTVYDPTTTVTVDPIGTNPLSPYIRNSNSPNMFPLFLMHLFDKFFVSPAYALESDQRAEQARNTSHLWSAKVKIDKAKLTDDIVKGKVTRTPTPTRTPTFNPTAKIATPTATPTVKGGKDALAESEVVK